MTDAIRDRLLRDYPCAVVPYGGDVAIASELGVSRQLVGQVRNRLGFEISRRTTSALFCAKCDKKLASLRSYLKRGKEPPALCRKCENAPIAVECLTCGRLFSKSRKAINLAAKDSRYTGRDFCSRQCFGSFLGRRYGFGNPEHPQRKKARVDAIRKSLE